MTSNSITVVIRLTIGSCLLRYSDSTRAEYKAALLVSGDVIDATSDNNDGAHLEAATWRRFGRPPSFSIFSAASDTWMAAEFDHLVVYVG